MHIIGNSKSNNGCLNGTSLQTKILQKVQWLCDVSDLYGRDEGYFQLIHTLFSWKGRE